MLISILCLCRARCPTRSLVLLEMIKLCLDASFIILPFGILLLFLFILLVSLGILLLFIYLSCYHISHIFLLVFIYIFLPIVTYFAIILTLRYHSQYSSNQSFYTIHVCYYFCNFVTILYFLVTTPVYLGTVLHLCCY